MRRFATPLESGRRIAGRRTGRLRSLPLLALEVHGACNCRCVMCDIWRANAGGRELSPGELAAHAEDIARLHVRRVMLTGGEPLMHSNLWALCDELRRRGIRITLVSTGLLLARDAANVASTIDHVVVSIDGSPAVHDRIRRVPGAYERLAAGVAALRSASSSVRITGRTVLQKANCGDVAGVIDAARQLALDGVSFLAADVHSRAFNRPEPWDASRRASVLPGPADLRALADGIRAASARSPAAFRSGFVEHGVVGLWRIFRYYAAISGQGELPMTRCNAPWVSAVLDLEGRLKPCFFHEPYDRAAGLAATLNSATAIAFRRDLDVTTNETCRRCVCTLHLPAHRTT